MLRMLGNVSGSVADGLAVALDVPVSAGTQQTAATGDGAGGPPRVCPSRPTPGSRHPPMWSTAAPSTRSWARSASARPAASNG